jgi:thiol-disulfide isomerase/thioredoxin
MIVLLALGLACAPHPSPPLLDPALAVPDPVAPPPPDPREQALFGEITLRYARADGPGAIAAIDSFTTDFPASHALPVLADWRDALARFGRPAPSLDVTRWVGETGSFADSGATLLVFFEPWCPHCKADVPQVELLRREYAERGLGVIGLTALSSEATDADLTAFIADGDLRFPIGVEDGGVSEAYGVSGVPHAVFVRGGTLVWSGHPSLLSLELVSAVVGGAPLPIAGP